MKKKVGLFFYSNKLKYLYICNQTSNKSLFNKTNHYIMENSLHFVVLSSESHLNSMDLIEDYILSSNPNEVKLEIFGSIDEDNIILKSGTNSANSLPTTLNEVKEYLVNQFTYQPKMLKPFTLKKLSRVLLIQDAVKSLNKPLNELDILNDYLNEEKFDSSGLTQCHYNQDIPNLKKYVVIIKLTT